MNVSGACTVFSTGLALLCFALLLLLFGLCMRMSVMFSFGTTYPRAKLAQFITPFNVITVGPT